MSGEGKAFSFATDLARALGGSVLELPSRPPRQQWCVRLAGGFHAAVVSDHASGFDVRGYNGQGLPREQPAAAQALESLRTHQDASVLEFALAALALLPPMLREGLEVRFLGNGNSFAEVHLSGPGCYAHLGSPESLLARGSLAGAAKSVARKLRQQAAGFTAAQPLERRLDELARELTQDLARHVPTPDGSAWRAYPESAPRRICWGRAATHYVAELVLPIELVIGPWRLPLDPLDLELVRRSITLRLATLTTDRLEPGARYRVLERLGEVAAGETVVYEGEDWENDRYEVRFFRNSAGTQFRVDDTSLLLTIDRYLAP